MLTCIDFSLPGTKATADKISVELDSMISPRQVGLIWSIWLNEDYNTRKYLEPTADNIKETYAKLAISTKQQILQSEPVKEKEKVLDFLQSIFFTMMSEKVGSPLITREDLIEYKSRLLKSLPAKLERQGFGFIADNFDYYVELLEYQRLSKFSMPETDLESEEFKQKDSVSSESSSFKDNKHNASDEVVYLVASLESDEEVYGFKKPLNFSQTWNTLQNLLADSIDFQDQIATLERSKEEFPFIQQLLNKLGVVDGVQQDSPRHRKVAQSFTEAFSKQFSDIIVATTSGKDSYSTIDKQTEASLKEKFKSKFFSSKGVKTLNGSLVTNLDTYKKLGLTGFSENELRQFLDFFGIPSDIEFDDNIKADLRQIKKQVDEAKSMIWLDDEKLDVQGRLGNIVKYFVPQEQMNKNLSSLNAEGKQQYAIHNHNFFSRYTRKLKIGRIKARNFFDRMFADGVAEKKIISGLQDDNKTNASVFSDLSLTDIAQTVINNMFSNNPILQIPRTADKSTERGIQLKTKGNNNDYIAFSKISDKVMKDLYELFNQDINDKLDPNWDYGAKTPNVFWGEIGIKSGDDFQTFKNKIMEFVQEQRPEVKKMLENLGVIHVEGNTWQMNFTNAALNKILPKGWENSSKEQREEGINKLIDNFSFNMFFFSVGYTKSMYGSLVPVKPSNLFKRFTAATAEGRQVSLSANMINEIAQDYKKQGFNADPSFIKVYVHKETITPSTDKKLHKISKNYEKNNEDDAQGIIMFPVYRAILKGVNQWTDAQEEAYEKVMKGEKVDKNVFPPIKPVGYSDIEIDGAKIPVFIKTSIYPMSPSDVKGTYNEIKYNYALENGTGLFIPESGIKIATPNELKPVINKDLTINDNPSFDFPIEDFRIQLDIAVKTTNDQLMGTQQRKLIFANAFTGGKPVNEKYKIILDEYIDTLEKIAQIEEKKLFDRLGVENTKDGVKINNLTEFKKMLRSDMISNEMSINVIDSIDNVIDENGNLIGKIDSLPGRQKIMNLLNSFITNNLIRLYINGTTLVQASNQGWEITTPDGETSIDFISKEHQRQYYENKGLRFFDLGENTGAAEILLPAKYKKFVKKNEEGDYIIDDEKIITNIGYRIPTQGHNSILHLKVVGFIPAHLDQLIIVPKEITTQGGSDFDVDKMNLFIPNTININGNIKYISSDMSAEEVYNDKKESLEKLIKFVESGLERKRLDFASNLPFDEFKRILLEEGTVRLTKEQIEETLEAAGFKKDTVTVSKGRLEKLVKEGAKESFIENFNQSKLENQLIEKTIEILSDPYFRQSILTPNSADKLKNSADKLTREILNPEINNTGIELKKPVITFGNVFKAKTLLTTIYQMFASKALVGVFASQSTHHTLAQQTGLYFKTGRPFFFEHNKTEDGDPDLSQITDKDGDNIADMLGNELLTAAVDAAKDDYLTELGINLQTGDIAALYQRIGGKKKYLRYWLRLPIIQEYLTEEAKNESILYKSTGRSKTKTALLKQFLESKKIDLTQLEYTSKDEVQTDLLKKRIDTGYYSIDDVKNALFNKLDDNQIIIHLFDDFLFLKDAATTLRKAIATSKFDTQGPGKNLMEAKMLQHSYVSFINEMNKSEGYTLGTKLDGNPAPYERMINDTMLKVFMPNSFPLVINLYKPLTILGMNMDIETVIDAFIDSKHGIVKKADKPYIMDMVYSGLINYMVQNGIGFQQDLFYGDNTVGHRINDIRKDETHPLYRNDFIQNFFNIEISRDANTPTILSPINKRLSSEDQQHFTGQLEEVKEYDVQLYEDLMKVALFQTGLQESPVSFYNIIPSNDMIPLVNRMINKSIPITDIKNTVKPILANLGSKLKQIFDVRLSKEAYVLPSGELRMSDSDMAKIGDRGIITTKYGIFEFQGDKWMRIDPANVKSLFYNYTKNPIESEQQDDTEMETDNRDLEETSTEVEQPINKEIKEDLTPKANIPQNLVSGKEAFGTKQEALPEIKKVLGSNSHSIDMIDAGFRTRTTRSVGEMEKYNIKVGDIVKQFGKSADGTTKNILTRVTAIHPKGTPGFLGTWNKEGWTQEGIKAIERFKDGAAAIEFELLTQEQPIIEETKNVSSSIQSQLKQQYDSLSKEDQNKIGTFEEVYDQYQNLPFDLEIDEFIDQLKCNS